MDVPRERQVDTQAGDRWCTIRYSNPIVAVPPSVIAKLLPGECVPRRQNVLSVMHVAVWLTVFVCATECVAGDVATVATGKRRLHLYECEWPAMGTRFAIKGYAKTSKQFATAADQAMQRVADLERCLSDYDAQSEVNRLTEHGSLAYRAHVPISESLSTVLQHAKLLFAQTNGAVDVTVGPVTRLWRRARRRHQLPIPSQLAEAAKRVGLDAVELYSNPRGACEEEGEQRSTSKRAQLRAPRSTSIRLKKLQMRFDFGAIGKGFAADEALRCLRASGIENCLVDAGGDVAIGAAPPGTAGWRIGCGVNLAGVTHSSNGDARNGVDWLCLSDCGVATSGDAARGFERADVRYSHVVVPAAGECVTGRKVVTIVAPSALTADGLATAASVLELPAALNLIESLENCELFCVRRVPLNQDMTCRRDRAVNQADDSPIDRQQTSGFCRLNRCVRSESPEE